MKRLATQRRADHRDFEAGRSRTGNAGAMSAARHQRANVLSLEGEVIVIDNGLEFRGRALAAWSEQHGVRLHFIDPGKPVQNTYEQSFSGRLRDECPNANWLVNLQDARTAPVRSGSIRASNCCMIGNSSGLLASDFQVCNTTTPSSFQREKPPPGRGKIPGRPSRTSPPRS